MRIIGITGGIGSGKSTLLERISRSRRCKVIVADEIAHEAVLPGQPCYERLIDLLGNGVLAEDGLIDRNKMAALIFRDGTLLEQVNNIIHPAVRTRIQAMIAAEARARAIDILFIEAALLIEAGYEGMLDELWYIHTDKHRRQERLKQGRGYTEEKTAAIMGRQLAEDDFRARCHVTIENNGTIEEAYQQAAIKLGEYQCQK